MIKLVAIFLTLVILPSIMMSVHAENAPPILVSTNKPFYQPGDKVVISGSVLQKIDNNPITIMVRNSIGNVYEVGQSDLISNSFVHDFVLDENPMGGQYTVNVRYGAQNVETHFIVNAGVLSTIPILDSQIKIRTNETNPITYGNASISIVNSTIKIPMDTSKTSKTLTDQQYQIPKKIIDFPGSQITLGVDGTPLSCIQSETGTIRILDCQIPSGAKELELTGATIIPEFGTTVQLVAIMSVILALMVTRTRAKIL